MARQKISTFLMFAGNAEEAMNHYVSTFEGSEITQILRYGPGEAGAEGSVMHAVFTLHGQQFMAIDSSVEQPFTFTPACSLHVTCDTEAEIDRAFERLSSGGQVLMPLSAYPFSRKYAWVQDRFGVSWQLSLA
ncbi:MAG TPA: VOC family protein [Symbiobacteriaceae bacterium]|nr:VOC family protein [Symbiobacteriaceae bacterium]